MNEIYDLTREITEQEEMIYRNAIRYTDWNDTAVLRIIMHQDKNIFTKDDIFSVPLPEYEIKRYPEKAPPTSEHHKGKWMEVTTITKPLLDRLKDEHPDIFRNI